MHGHGAIYWNKGHLSGVVSLKKANSTSTNLLPVASDRFGNSGPSALSVLAFCLKTQVFIRLSHFCEFIYAPPLPPPLSLENCFAVVFHCLWFWKSFALLFSDDPWIIGGLSSAWWLVVGLQANHHLLQKGSLSDEGWEMHHLIGIMISH